MAILRIFIENNLGFIFSAVSSAVIILFFWTLFLEIKFQSFRKLHAEFFAESKIKNLEELILHNTKTIKVLDHDIQELFNISNQINTLAEKGLHKTGLVRFNPFKDVGGDQSFALAVLNGKNNGFTLSSLYTREGARIYAKSIVNKESEKYPLTEEEKEAIQIALKP